MRFFGKASHTPWLAHCSVAHAIGLVIADELVLGRIPLQGPSGPCGDATQVGGNRRLAAGGHVAYWPATRANCFQPVPLMVRQGNQTVVVAGAVLREFRGIGYEKTATADVDPSALAHDDGPERLDRRQFVPTLRKNVFAGVESLFDQVDGHVVGIHVGQVGKLTSSRRQNLRWSGLVQPQGTMYRVKVVDGVAGECPPAKVFAEVPRHNAPGLTVLVKPVIEGAPGGRAEPAIPVQSVRNRLGRQLDLAARARLLDVDTFDLAQGSGVDQSAGQLELGRRPLVVTHLAGRARSCG